MLSLLIIRNTVIMYGYVPYHYFPSACVDIKQTNELMNMHRQMYKYRYLLQTSANVISVSAEFCAISADMLIEEVH